MLGIRPTMLRNGIPYASATAAFLSRDFEPKCDGTRVISRHSNLRGPSRAARCRTANATCGGRQGSVTLGISAIVAHQAALLGTQRLCAAARAKPAAAAQHSAHRGALTGSQRLGLGALALLAGLTGRRQEAGADRVGLDHPADGSQQARHVAPAHPLAALRIEYGLELLDHEGDVSAAPEDGADHAGERHRPGVVLEVLGVDEDLERPS